MHSAVLYFDEVNMTTLILFCTITYAGIVDCYDTKKQCIEDYAQDVMECAKCFEYKKGGNTFTDCPEFGYQTYEVNHGARDR